MKNHDRTNCLLRWLGRWWCFGFCLCCGYWQDVLGADNLHIRNVGNVSINGAAITISHCSGGTIGTLGSSVNIAPSSIGGDFFSSINNGELIKATFFNPDTGSYQTTDCVLWNGDCLIDVWPGYSGNPATNAWNITLCVTNTSTHTQYYTPRVNGVAYQMGLGLEPGQSHCWTYHDTNKANLTITAQDVLFTPEGVPADNPRIVASANDTDPGWWQDGTSQAASKSDNDPGKVPPQANVGTNSINFPSTGTDLAKEETVKAGFSAIYVQDNQLLNEINNNIKAGFYSANANLGNISGKLDTANTKLGDIKGVLDAMKIDAEQFHSNNLAYAAAANEHLSNIDYYTGAHTNTDFPSGTDFSDKLTWLKEHVDASPLTNGFYTASAEWMDHSTSWGSVPGEGDTVTGGRKLWEFDMPGWAGKPHHHFSIDPSQNAIYVQVKQWIHGLLLLLMTYLYLHFTFKEWHAYFFGTLGMALSVTPNVGGFSVVKWIKEFIYKAPAVMLVVAGIVALIAVVPVAFVNWCNNNTIFASVWALVASTWDPSILTIKTMVFLINEFFPVAEGILYLSAYWTFRFSLVMLVGWLVAACMAVKSYFAEGASTK